jgi:hypothetical protein
VDLFRGAYDRDTTLDETFRVECHSDVVEGQCCLAAVVQATRYEFDVSEYYHGDNFAQQGRDEPLS